MIIVGTYLHDPVVRSHQSVSYRLLSYNDRKSNVTNSIDKNDFSGPKARHLDVLSPNITSFVT